ncbi:hypothetical protein Tco_1213535 [Tanacetum coccineum]
MGRPGDNQSTRTNPARKVLQRATSPPLPKRCLGRITTAARTLPPPAKQGSKLGNDKLTLEVRLVATELASSDFVSQKLRDFGRPHAEETKERSRPELQARLNSRSGGRTISTGHQKEGGGGVLGKGRKGYNVRPPVFGRIGKKVSGTQTANLQNLDTHENNDWRISVRDRLGSRDVHSRLGQRHSPSESPPSSDSEDSRRKRRRRVVRGGSSEKTP